MANAVATSDKENVGGFVAIAHGCADGFEEFNADHALGLRPGKTRVPDAMGHPVIDDVLAIACA